MPSHEGMTWHNVLDRDPDWRRIMPKTYTVPPPPHHNEGKTAAAWTMNLGIVLGSVPIAAGLILPDLDILLWIGAAIVLLAIVVGAVMSRAGLGQPKHYGRSAAVAAAVEHGAEEAPAEAGTR
jgi:hypothetical protein